MITTRPALFRPHLCTTVLAIIVSFGIGRAAPGKARTETAAAASEPCSTGEILQVVGTVNNGEIAQAKLAIEKSGVRVSAGPASTYQ